LPSERDESDGAVVGPEAEVEVEDNKVGVVEEVEEVEEVVGC
jgi:hypothetical protein